MPLALLWQMLRQHAAAGACVHRGTCPTVKIGAVVVDEAHRTLMLGAPRGRPRLPEASLTYGGDGLPEDAAVLARSLGVGRPWLPPGGEVPLLLDVARADPEDGLRTRVALRFLVRARAEECVFVEDAPQFWAPREALGITLAKRLDAALAEGIS
jgi:hypothetical protein